MNQKSKKQAARGLGKSKTAFNPKQLKGIKFEDVQSGNDVLVSQRLLDGSGSGVDIFSTIAVNDLKDCFETAYALSCADKHLGLRRQLEQGRGLLLMMDAGFRQAHGIYDSLGAPIVFNWYTIDEIKQIPRDSLVFGNSKFLKPLSLWLAERCLLKSEFPCLWRGVPMNTSSELGRFNLLMVIKEDSQSPFPLNVRHNELFI